MINPTNPNNIARGKSIIVKKQKAAISITKTPPIISPALMPSLLPSSIIWALYKSVSPVLSGVTCLIEKR